jgi:MFS family permease
VIASLVMGQLMGAGSPTLAFVVIGAVLVIAALVTGVFSPEPPAASAPPSPVDRAPAFSLHLGLRDHPAYSWLLFSRFLILLGVYAVQGFAQYYIGDWLGMPEPVKVTGNLMAAIGLALTLLVLPAGLLSDRFGRVRMNLLAGGLATLGIFLLVFARNALSLYLFGAIVGMATGIFLSVNWALATDLIPQEEGGKYLGLSNLATAGAGAASRLAGPLIDGVNALRPGAYLGYPVVFVLAAASALAGTLLLLRIRRLQPGLA